MRFTSVMKTLTQNPWASLALLQQPQADKPGVMKSFFEMWGGGGSPNITVNLQRAEPPIESLFSKLGEWRV